MWTHNLIYRGYCDPFPVIALSQFTFFLFALDRHVDILRESRSRDRRAYDP